MIDPGTVEQASATKKTLSEDAAAAAAKAKAAGPKVIYADGQAIDLTDPNIRDQWDQIEAAAVKRGSYEGKSLEWLGGGRSALLYDKLRVEGYDDSGARMVVAKNFQAKANEIMQSGTAEQRAQLTAYFKAKASGIR